MGLKSLHHTIRVKVKSAKKVVLVITLEDFVDDKDEKR